MRGSTVDGLVRSGPAGVVEATAPKLIRPTRTDAMGSRDGADRGIRRWVRVHVVFRRQPDFRRDRCAIRHRP